MTEKRNLLRDLAWQYLEALYELSEGGLHPEVDYRKVQSELGFSDDEARGVVRYLEGKDLVSFKCRVTCIRITTRGIDEVDAAMQKSYAEKENQVLKAIYDLSGQNTTKLVGFHEIVPATGMSDREVSGICKGLEQQGFIEWEGGDVVFITHSGINAIDSLGKPKPPAGDTYHTSIGSVIGGVQVGPGNVQNIQINNPEFDRAIAAVLDLIRSSQLPNTEIEELQGEVVKLNRLALSEPKPGLLEKAKTRIDLIKLGLAGTDVLIKAGPHLEQIWDFLRTKFS